MATNIFVFLKKIRSLGEAIPSNIQDNKNAMDKLVFSFINSLGYRYEDILKDYYSKAASIDEKIDVVVLKGKKPIMGYFYTNSIDLEIEKYLSRIKKIFEITNIPFIILTNGVKYEFFTDILEQGKLDNEPFLVVDLINPLDPIIKELYQLTRQNIDPHYIPRRKNFTREHVSKNFLNFKREPILGEETAEADWVYNESPEGVLCDTNSYQVFKEIDTLFLYGFRGSGKTALMKMLEYEIISKKNNTYQYVNVISQRYIIDAFRYYSANYVLNQTDNQSLIYLSKLELVENLKAHWQWIINVSSMLAVFRSEFEKFYEDVDLRFVSDYLLRLFKKFDPHIDLNKLKAIIENKPDKIIERDNATHYTIIRHLAEMENLITDEYYIAMKALTNFLDKNSSICLIMFDSIDYYDFQDNLLNAIINGLIEATKESYTNWRSNRTLVKTAFASEIFRYINEINPDHSLGHKLFIEWQYKELVILLSKRFYRYLLNHNTPGIIDANSNRLNEYYHAKEFLYRHLPENIISPTTGFNFDTLAYVIMHTQKKPRQMIYLFNIIFTLGKGQSIKDQPELIYTGTHIGLEALVKGTLNIYRSIYEDAPNLISTILFRSQSDFDADDLDWLIKRSSSYQGDLDTIDIKRLLIECGALGIETKRKLLLKGKIFIKGEFQYQVPNRIFPNPQSRYLVHPMFYTSLETLIDIDKIIYPMPIELDIQEKEALMKMGL